MGPSTVIDNRQIVAAGTAIVFAQLSINVGAAIGKKLFPLIGPEGVAALRTLIAALFLIAIARPWRHAMSRRQIGWMFLYGLTLGGMNLLIYLAFARIPIGVAVSIEILGPLSIVLLSSRSFIDLLWALTAACGLAILLPWPGADAPLDLLGVAYALAAAACWALYILVGKQASELETSVTVAVGMTVATIITLPLGVASAGSNLLINSVLLWSVAVALLSSAIPYMLEMKALKQLTSRLFGLITSSAPGLAALAGFLVLDEGLNLTQCIAIGLMMGASAGGSLTWKSNAASPEQGAAI